MAAKKAKTEKKDKEGRDAGEDSPIGRKGARGPMGVDIDKSKIKLLVKENPKREGSTAHEQFALYKEGMTVRQYLEVGGRTSGIKYDVAHEFVKLV